MGLLVPELILPDGRHFSNVYVSLNNSFVYTHPVRGQDYQMSCMVRVYSSPDREELPIYEFPIEIPNSDLTKGPFVNIYAALRAMFPEGTDYQN